MALVILGGCSNPSSPDNGPSVDIGDYLPLVDGAAWTYVGERSYETTVTCAGPQSVGGHSVYELTGGIGQYYFLTGDGLYFLDYPYYNTPVRVMPATVSVGTSCTGHGNFEWLAWTCVSTAASVSVPAGDFDDCLKIEETAPPSGQLTVEKHLWFAPGVGLVKEVSVIGGGCDSGYVMAMGDAGLLEVELSSYTTP